MLYLRVPFDSGLLQRFYKIFVGSRDQGGLGFRGLKGLGLVGCWAWGAGFRGLDMQGSLHSKDPIYTSPRLTSLGWVM